MKKGLLGLAGLGGLALASKVAKAGGLVFNDGTTQTAGIAGWSANGANNDLLPDSASAGIYLGVNSATAANLLDDYEEGTWNPTVVGASSGTFTVGGSETTAAYTKIGRNVFVNGQLNITGESSPSGQIRISLPFTTASLTETSDGSAITTMIQSHGGTFNQPTGFTQQGEAYFRLWSVNDSGTLTVIGDGEVDGAWTINFGGHFQTDS